MWIFMSNAPWPVRRNGWNNQCRRKLGSARTRCETRREGADQKVRTKKSPLYVERAESISGGDVEETSTNIHMGLVRRNNFLRENPISGQIVALFHKTTVWRGFQPYEEPQ